MGLEWPEALRNEPHPRDPWKIERGIMKIFDPIAWIILGGLLVWGYGAATEKRSEKVATSTARLTHRKEEVQAIINAGPQTRVWETTQGSVITLDIPKAGLGGRFVETKHCTIWRDTATRTSALHCDKDEVDTRDYPSDAPEVER